jgi:hypothetical protein
VDFVVVLGEPRAACKGAVGAAVGERSHAKPAANAVSAIVTRRAAFMAYVLLTGAGSAGRE